MHDLPYQTHKRFVESLTEFPHVQSMLHGRYIGFLENLKNSRKSEIKLLYNMCSKNVLSNTGENISFLMTTYTKHNVNELFYDKHNIKLKRVYELEQNEEWKPQLIKEIALVNRGLLDNGLEEKVNKELLIDLCCN